MANKQAAKPAETTWKHTDGPVLQGIRQRLGDRRRIEAEWKETKVPTLTSTELMKEFKKVLNEMKDKRLDADFLEVDDFTCILGAALDMAEANNDDLNKYVNARWYKHPIGAEERAILDARDVAAAEAREKEARAAAKANGGMSPGQKKMVNDDGSIAEEASAVTTEKLTAENDPANQKEKKDKADKGKKPAEVGSKEVAPGEVAKAGKAAEQNLPAPKTEEPDPKAPAAGAAQPGPAATANK